MSNPSLEHYKALDNIWAYLNKTKDYSLSLQSATDSLSIIGYTDADWGGDLATRKSTSGYINLISSTLNKDFKGLTTFLISWNSKLQKTVALSSCEAEYMAFKESIKETLFINNLLSELPPSYKGVFLKTRDIYTDSKSAIALAKDPVYYSRTKHVDIRYNFVKEKVNNNEVNLIYCPTERLLADGLTKAISTNKWIEFIYGLGINTDINSL